MSGNINITDKGNIYEDTIFVKLKIGSRIVLNWKEEYFIVLNIMYVEIEFRYRSVDLGFIRKI